MVSDCDAATGFETLMNGAILDLMLLGKLALMEFFFFHVLRRCWFFVFLNVVPQTQLTCLIVSSVLLSYSVL